jgi:alkyl sulfatase BDS1-like metallo-beta-lactamase superfamily hydrolase
MDLMEDPTQLAANPYQHRCGLLARDAKPDRAQADHAQGRDCFGSVKVRGSEAKLDEMLSYLDSFDFWFNIVAP